MDAVHCTDNTNKYKLHSLNPTVLYLHLSNSISGYYAMRLQSEDAVIIRKNYEALVYYETRHQGSHQFLLRYRNVLYARSRWAQGKYVHSVIEFH